MDERRIMVHGVTGSGKTTAARRISEATGVPWHAVDELIWQPGWVPVPEDEQHRRITEICAGEAWLLDTAYGAWVQVPLSRVELIVALDYPRWFSLQRLVRRTFARVAGRRPVCNGNNETLRRMFSRESIIAWHFHSFPRRRAQVAAWMAQPDGPRVVRFTRARQAERWIDGLDR